MTFPIAPAPTVAHFDPITVATRHDRVLLRAAAVTDAAALIAQSVALAHEGGGTIQAPDEVDTDPQAQQRKIQKYIDAPDDVIIVAESQGRVVGGASFRAGHTRRTSHHGLLGVSVDREFRGRGIGRALVTAILHWCRARQRIEKVSLWVFADNTPALALYRSLGFIEEGRRAREIRLGPGLYTDDLIMAIFLRPGNAGETR